MRQRKIFISLILAIALVIETSCLSWAITRNDHQAVVTYTLRVVFSIYTVVLAVHSINQVPHFESIVHISALTFFFTTLLFVSSIIPSVDTSVLMVLVNGSAVLRGMSWAVVALHFVAFAVASTIPQSPPLHYALEKIYSGTIVATNTDISQDNVCGITSAPSAVQLLCKFTQLNFFSCFCHEYPALLIHN
jgi:hypothetical protein